MKLKDMKFTEKTLVDTNACQDAIDFCDRNGLFCNTRIKNLEITGGYRGWEEWLNYRLDWGLEYDTSGNLVEIIRPDDTTETRKYDTAGNLVEITYPDDTTGTRKYDASGNPVEIKYWDGKIETREYDSLGNITKICGVNGKFYRYKYKKTKKKFVVMCNGKNMLEIHNPEGWA